MKNYSIQETKRSIVIFEDENKFTFCKKTFETKVNQPIGIYLNAFKCLATNELEALEIFKVELIRQHKIKRLARESFDSNLSDFWKDVKSRVGMDVCTPFMEKYPTHSFVAYDNGIVWSKTMKTAFKTINGSVAMNGIPKTCIKIVSFGADI